jgi:pimeloyl-ACP methyl ester carboxylesterase
MTGAPLAWTRTGAGPPLLLVHGSGSHRKIWDPVLERVAREREVVALDLPGHGESPALPAGDRYTPGRLAESLGRLLDELKWERPHVAGHSLGGGVAYELALAGRAHTLTALAPIGFWTPREAAYCRRSLRASRALGRLLAPVGSLALRTAPQRAALMWQLFARPGRIPPDIAVADSRLFATAPGLPGVIRDALVGSYRWREPPPVPLTVAWGDRDRLLLPRQAERARRRFPDARHVWLEGCGHGPQWDDPGQAAAVLLAGSEER